MTTSNGFTQYKPYNPSDVHYVTDQLPPLTGGGTPWSKALSATTSGTPLAERDLRAILAKCSSLNEYLEMVFGTHLASAFVPSELCARVESVLSCLHAFRLSNVRAEELATGALCASEELLGCKCLFW
ncbi:hypothetical protein EYF80_037611 [Liparis tanakae]|uniref:Uncharacterized protein n=1 Tax=Liparis tanakae TaxID=230148 RepID=A0A4Z2GG18_9TELE|nr:hypothetical protein EYF80_037611 [Liparis tanakae]